MRIILFALFSLVVTLCPLASRATVPPVKKHILIIVTSNTELFGSGRKTGVWLDELAEGYYDFQAAGDDVTIVSILGLQPPIDPRSEEKKTAIGTRFLHDADAMRQFSNTEAFSTVDPASYDAVFLPGGHGAVWDFFDNHQLAEFLNHFVRDHKVIGAVGHGTMALIGLSDKGGHTFIKDRHVCGFTKEEETALGLETAVPNYADRSMAWVGAKISCGKPFVARALRDGQLITGQNPASTPQVIKLMLEAMK